MSGQTERCGNCRFFKMHTEPDPATAGVGWCRYNAPSVPVKPISESVWSGPLHALYNCMFPLTREEQWCGKYKVEERVDKP